MQPAILKRVELRLYYSLLRSGIKFDTIMETKNGDIEREIKRLSHCYPPKINRAYDSVKNAVKVSFRGFETPHFDNEKVFYAMKHINNRLDVVSNAKWKPNNHIKYDIGQIMRHKKHKFRLVLVDSFSKCPCDKDWIETYGPFEDGINQPFYKTMVCTKDREPFMSIAAQENLTPIDAVNDGQAVEHPLIDEVFVGYDAEGGRMIPYEYFFKLSSNKRTKFSLSYTSMSHSSVNEWFYHSSTAGRNSSGITLLQLKQLISHHKLHSNSQIWHPTYVPQWTPLKALPQNVQKLLNLAYHKTKSKQTPKHRNHRKRKDKSNRDHSASYSHSNDKRHHRKHRKPTKRQKTAKYKKKMSPRRFMIRDRSTSDSRSSAHSDSGESYKNRRASSQSGTPTVSVSSTIMCDYSTEHRSKSKSKKIATIHRRTDSAPPPNKQASSSGFILKNILYSDMNKKSKSLPFEAMSSDYDSDHRNLRKVSMGSDVTIPPPFPIDNIDNISDLEIYHVPPGNISPDASTPKEPAISSRYKPPRKNSDSFDINSIAPISDLARNFASNRSRSELDEKYENDDDHTISIKPSMFTKSRSENYTHNRSKTIKKRQKKTNEARHITRVTKKGRVSIKRSTEKYKKTPKGPKREREIAIATPIPNVRLKQFMNEYNDTHRERLRNKMNVTKKVYNKCNAKSLEIERKHFHAEHTHKKSDLYLKERFVEKQIEVYSKGTAMIKKNMKSSTDLREYIASNLDTKDRKAQRMFLRRENETLQNEMNECMKYASTLNTITAEMMDDVSKQNKSMLISRKALQEQIQHISSVLDSESMEMQCEEIFSQKQTLLQIPRNTLSSEGDTKLDFDELHDPLYILYKDITQQRTEWFADRTNIREQCMIHRMFWKKYTQWRALQDRMDEMRKREKQQRKYTKALRNEMNDMMENGKMDRFQLQINTKQALIHAKEEALKEKQETLRDLQQTLKKYKVSVAAMKEQNDDMMTSNDGMHDRIQRAAKERYDALMDCNKIEPEMKRYLMERKKAVQSQRTTLEQLWKEMNEKRYRLKSLQFETKRIKQEQNDIDGETLGDTYDEDISNIYSSEDTDTDTEKERVQNSLKLEQQHIKELKQKLEKKKQEMNKIEAEMEQKQQIKTKHDKSLQLVQKRYDDINGKYKQLNGKIDGLNEERHDKFKQMFDGILLASNKVSNISQFKRKQQISMHDNMEVDEAKEDENKNDINVIVRGEIHGENEEKSSEISGHHEPGTTPPKYEPIQSMTQTGSMLVDGIHHLCTKNNGIINKIFDDLKYVYDMNDDLDFENTMFSIRSVMDSIRNDRATLNDKLLKEKEILQRKEKEIVQTYKKQRNVLKKEREIKKKEFQRERKKSQSKQLLQRMSTAALEAHGVSIEYGDKEEHKENDDGSFSSLSDVETVSSLDSENDKYKSKNIKKERKAKRSFKRVKHSRVKTKNLITDL